MKKSTTPRVNRITIERLFNLGSYEHVKYAFSVEIPEDSTVSPSETLVGIERILHALNPNRLKTVQSEMDLERAQRTLQEDALLSDDAFNRKYGTGYAGTRADYQARMRRSWEEACAKRKQVCADAEKARKMIDELGASAVWKDAKLDWETDNGE